MNAGRLAVIAVAAVTAGACGGDLPSEPTPVPPVVEQPVPRPPAPAVTYRVRGVVTDETGAPVAGASVAFWMGARQVIFSTDGTGDYRAELETIHRDTVALVEKAGFEPGAHYVSLIPERETVRNLRIHHVMTINAGELLHFDLKPDEGACGFDLEFWCRRIRVRSRSAGTLTMRVDREGSGSGVGLEIGSVDYPFQFKPSLSVRVDGDTHTVVDVLTALVTTSQRLTLSTSLE